jgi:hypothetical protein
MSLYGLVILSKETNRNDEALVLAQQIFDKKHKVLSRVGNEMTKVHVEALKQYTFDRRIFRKCIVYIKK